MSALSVVRFWQTIEAGVLLLSAKSAGKVEVAAEWYVMLL